MTKTLTEQWREGTLPDGAYYILVDKYEQNEPEIDVGVCYNSNFEWWIVKEVLSPVPSYKEWKQMIDGDKATIHHLKKILPTIEYNKVAYDYLKQVIEDMEKEIEEVK